MRRINKLKTLGQIGSQPVNALIAKNSPAASSSIIAGMRQLLTIRNVMTRTNRVRAEDKSRLRKKTVVTAISIPARESV
ncbi:hypothetical protein LOC69_20720 [Blastopirellula sp. JC733]|nr:hypothetical protein [Blastopirellula sediminis]